MANRIDTRLGGMTEYHDCINLRLSVDGPATEEDGTLIALSKAIETLLQTERGTQIINSVACSVLNRGIDSHGWTFCILPDGKLMTDYHTTNAQRETMKSLMAGE